MTLEPRVTPTAEDAEARFRRHVLDAWFPRCLDAEYGGFLCDFDRRWEPSGPNRKLLEFQARQTMVSALGLEFFGADERLARATMQGFRYLHDAMWDAESGGWFHQLDRAGHPLASGTKHAHGFAYAIHACVAVHDATGDPAALALATEAFEWLEAHAFDAEGGGYHEFFTRDGRVIDGIGEDPSGRGRDPLGTPIGCKNLNTHSDLLEALMCLYRSTSDPRVRDRVALLDDVIRRKALMPSGDLPEVFRPGWEAVPYVVVLGHACQAVYRLLDAGEILGAPGSAEEAARRVMDRILEAGWDPASGGVCFRPVGTAMLPGEPPNRLVKMWWVQAEALRALLRMNERFPEERRYADRFADQWRLIDRRLIDPRYGGVYEASTGHLPPWRRRLGARLAPEGATRKGHQWKDASHEGRAWLDCLRVWGRPGRADGLDAGGPDDR